MTYGLSVAEVCLRLILAVVVSGVIGYDREHKNRPAGLRTHILVCVGACIIALVQKEIGFNALNIAVTTPKLAGVVRADDARLIAQVVSGIGFLGAGTIIVQHRAVRGLTTAASLWAVACEGLAVGMGNYVIALAGMVVVFVVLVFLKRIIHVNTFKRLEISYEHKLPTKEFIQQYFDDHKIVINDVNFSVTVTSKQRLYTNVYELEIPKSMNYADVIEDLSMNMNVRQVRTISL
jgi:putative Mg2+ transporter-C (MgtC) family protein